MTTQIHETPAQVVYQNLAHIGCGEYKSTGIVRLGGIDRYEHRCTLCNGIKYFDKAFPTYVYKLIHK